MLDEHLIDVGLHCGGSKTKTTTRALFTYYFYLLCRVAVLHGRTSALDCRSRAAHVDFGAPNVERNPLEEQQQQLSWALQAGPEYRYHAVVGWSRIIVLRAAAGVLRIE